MQTYIVNKFNIFMSYISMLKDFLADCDHKVIFF